MAANLLDYEEPIAQLEALLAELRSAHSREEAEAQGLDLDTEIKRLEAQLRHAMKQVYGNLSPWQKTQMARHRDRPYALDYIRLILDEFMELSGDRLYGNDEAIVGGFAFLNGSPVVVIGQQKGRDLRERQRRNFGSAHAEGFRKAVRIAKMAAKFRKPLISFIDTPAAAADLAAEERGVSEAIARAMFEYSQLETPIVTVIIGEGGSGGAISIAIGDRVLMLEHAVYSVIPPEGCAAILWRDNKRAPEAAEALQLTADAAHRRGIVDEVLKEPLGGAHRDLPAMADTIKSAIVRNLAELSAQPVDALVEARYQRLRSVGYWTTD